VLQELSRLKADAAAQQLSRAERSMADAKQRMQQGEKSDDAQEEALDKLDRAQDELERQREQVEDELDREKREKLFDRVNGIRERQETIGKDAERMNRVKPEDWTRGRQSDYAGLAQAQVGLAEELRKQVESHFKPIKVAAKLLEQSAEAMTLASEKMDARLTEIVNRPGEKAEQKLRGDVSRWQQTALRRLDQLLDALKPDKDLKQPGGEKPQGGQPPGGGGGGGMRGGGEGVPILAQLKALRSLQAEVTERTAQFAKDHPDLAKLTEDEQADLRLLRKMQADVAELLRDYNGPDDPKEGGRP
jgi:hypothetical protein